MATSASITSYTNGFYASNTDAATGGAPGRAAKIDPPNLLSNQPFVPSGVGRNIARKSGFDTLSSGTVPSDTGSSLIGILSSPAYGQHWGCRDVTGAPGLSAVGVLWTLPNGESLLNDSGTYAQRSSAGIAGNGTSTRKIHLSSGVGAHTRQRTTTILTHLSCAVNLAVVYKDGSSAGYQLSADAAMRNSTFSGNGYTGHKGLSATGAIINSDGNIEGNYKTYNNVGPNIRRLVQLGYR